MKALVWFLLAIISAANLAAATHRGIVKFSGAPLPGATVTAVQGGKELTAVTEMDGSYAFSDLPEGTWTLRVEMLLFETQQRETAVKAGAPDATWEMKLTPAAGQNLPAVAMGAAPAGSGAPAAQPPAKRDKKSPQVANTGSGFKRADLNATAAAQAPAPGPEADTAISESAPSDGYLINGSVNNGNNSPFAQSSAFGNARFRRSLYNAALNMNLSHAALDARPYSLTGIGTPKPDYARATGSLSVSGPVRIPGLIRNGPNMTVSYSWARNRDASTISTRVPSLEERTGNFAMTQDALGRPVTVIDPSTGLPFPNATIPDARISPQARGLLGLYPKPNVSNAAYNYQAPLLGAAHADGLTASGNKSFRSKNSIAAQFSFQSSRGDSPSVLGFADRNRGRSVSAALSYNRRITSRQTATLQYQFTRQSMSLFPFFSNTRNISGEAGITGNNQEPTNWGPPTLAFTSGIATLSDAQSSLSRNQTSKAAAKYLWYAGTHNVTFGAEYTRQQNNLISQQDARGTFTFTGQAAGYDLAGFLLGIPDASSIAFGNADKYFRSSTTSLYVTDDWRLHSSVTLVLGLRWDYDAPTTELRGRLVNLDIAPGYSKVAPVIAADPVGPLTGKRYPGSLLTPDKGAIQPRVGFSWRPIPTSSLVVRGGYGIYRDNNVYQTIASRMAQQSPLSRSLSVQNSAANPLTLASGFNAAPNITTNTFAVDPDFHVGYSQNWQLSLQKDLPASLVTIITYAGVKGTRLQQEFLPNTYPAGALNPCPSCPSGYAYLTSNGNSTRNSLQAQLRRRLRRGFTAEAGYTFSKSIDDGAPGTQATYAAQNWLDLGAERALSNFDRRHTATIQAQYSTGMGLGGSTVMSGWRTALFGEWTIVAQLTVGSGTPLTPVFPAIVTGTGIQGSVRPDFTGAPLYQAPAGRFLNPAAITAPAPGRWGNAGRNTITGPPQFSTMATLSRTFRFTDRINADLRLEASNPLNHVTYSRWNTYANPQFGLPSSANSMRTVQLNLRVRF